MRNIKKIGLVIFLIVLLTSGASYAAYDYQSAIAALEDDATPDEKKELVEDLFFQWCIENDVEVIVNDDYPNGILGNSYNPDIDLIDISEEIKNSLNDEQLKIKWEMKIIRAEGVMNTAFNQIQMRSRLVKRLGAYLGVDVSGNDGNDDYVDPEDPEANPPQGEGWRPSAVIDVLAGILLYPLKLLVLVVAEGLNILLTGIIALGGKVDGIVSVSDIIFTTGEGRGIELASIDFFNITGASDHITGLRKAVANWFFVLRNLSIVISLCILIYTGIRMAISALAEDKARYKTLLMNWLIQMILVFFMQYIIFGIIGINNALVKTMQTGITGQTIAGESASGYMQNLFQVALEPTVSRGFGASILYCVLIGMTIAFAIMYIKRMITIAFLIVISPAVTVTYAVDKIGDSRSQAMNTWLREFAYNVLIQPFHCIIYLVFVSSAMQMLMNADVGNFGAPVLVIVTMLFMFKAEDILRRIFGFDRNTKTLGSGLATAAMVGSGLGVIKNIFTREKKSEETKQKDTIPDVKSVYQNNRAMQETNNNEQIRNANNGNIANTDKKEVNSNGNNTTETKGNNVLGKFVGGQAKLALPVVAAFIGAGQGKVSSMVAAGGAGVAVQKVIENSIKKSGGASTEEIKRQVESNEIAYGEIYKAYEQKWKEKDGRWEHFSNEQIIEDINNMMAMQDLTQIKDEDVRTFASVTHTQNDTYKAVGYQYSEDKVGELIRKIQKDGK